MRALCIIVLTMIALPDRPNPTPKEAPKPFHDQLVGEWRLVNGVIGGKEKAEERRTIFVFTKTEIRIRENNRQAGNEDALYTLDVTKNPIHIEISPKQDGDKRVPGIIKLDGDILTLCFSHDGAGARPVDFTSAPGTPHALLQFERIKK